MQTASSSPASAKPASDASHKTALDIFAERVAESGPETALRRKVGTAWRASTWNDWSRAASEIAGGLIGLGVTPGDRVVILARTRQEWVECELGVLRAGAICVPIYPSNTPEQCEYVINDASATVLIVEDAHQLEKLMDTDVAGKLAGVTHVIYMEGEARLERPDHQGRTTVPLDAVWTEGDKIDDAAVLSLDDLRRAGRQWLGANEAELDTIAHALDPAQAATIIYTSGTTGPPKGVVLTHANIAFECSAVKDLLGIGPDDEQLMFLPLAHSFAKVLEWSGIMVGAAMAFAESVPKLIDNMKEVRPTFMGAVPRVYEKAYVKIQANFAAKRKKALGRMIIDFALRQGQRRSRLEQQGHTASGLGLTIADKLVFAKVRATFGGRLKFFISGGAPLAREIAEFFHAAGILVLEGYGLTETMAATHVNRPDSFEFGTVGPPLPGVEMKIASDGEILVRGGNVMKEYFGKPEATAEVLDPDGWFRTGDIGVIGDNGHLTITDRKKDIIVTAGGKNVAPQNLENSMKAACPYVSQVMVHGDKRKFLSALVTLNEEMIVPWARERSLGDTSIPALAVDPQVVALVQAAFDELNADLASYETIKKFHILDTDFDQETGELTPTLKVKRKFVTAKFQSILDGFYEGLETSL